MTVPIHVIRNVRVSIDVECARRQLEREQPDLMALYREATNTVADIWMCDEQQRARLIRLAAVCQQWVADIDREAGR